MKKKIIMLTLSVMLALSGCGGSASENTESTNKTEIQTEEVAVAGKTTPGTGVVATASPEKNADKEKATPKPEATKAPAKEEISGGSTVTATETPKVTEAPKATATPKVEVTKAPAKEETSGDSSNTGSGTTEKPKATEAPKTTATPKPEPTKAPVVQNTPAPTAAPTPKPTQAPAHEHSWDGGSVTTEATCGGEGTKTYRCSCGETKTESIASLGHAYQTETVAATCGSDGYTADVCSRCGNRTNESTVPANGNHNYVEDYVMYAPACAYEGYMITVCTGCGQKSDAYIPPTGNHNYQCDNTPCGGEPSHMVCTECYDWYDGPETSCWDNDGDEICDNCNGYLGED